MAKLGRYNPCDVKSHLSFQSDVIKLHYMTKILTVKLQVNDTSYIIYADQSINLPGQLGLPVMVSLGMD